MIASELRTTSPPGGGGGCPRGGEGGSLLLDHQADEMRGDSPAQTTPCASTCININIATRHLLASQKGAWDTFGEEFGQTGCCPRPVQTHSVSPLPGAPFSAPRLPPSEVPLPYLLFVIFGQTWSKLSKRTHPGCFPKLILFLKLKEEEGCGEVGMRFLPSVASVEELTVSILFNQRGEKETGRERDD